MISYPALLLAAVAAAPECVVLEGAEALVTEVRAALNAPEPCRPVTARLSWIDGGIEVATADASRRVSTPRLAAAVVESWATPPAFGLATPPPGPPAAPVAAPESMVAEVVEPSEARVHVAAYAEMGVSESAAPNGGALVRGDVRFGDVFVWAGTRFAYTPRYATTTFFPPSRRFEAALLLGAEARFQVGAVSIAPGLFSGLDVVHASAIERDATRTVPGVVLGGGFRGSVPLGDDLALELFASADYRPLARGHGIDIRVAFILAPMPSPDPRWGARLGLGLRWGLL